MFQAKLQCPGSSAQILVKEPLRCNLVWIIPGDPQDDSVDMY